MQKVKVVLNRAAVRQLLKSPEIRRDLEQRGNRIASRAGDGHIVDSNVGATRARVAVVTDTFEAMRAEATDRTLTRALDAGR